MPGKKHVAAHAPLVCGPKRCRVEDSGGVCFASRLFVRTTQKDEEKKKAAHMPRPIQPDVF